jgi:hypothetical protein
MNTKIQPPPYRPGQYPWDHWERAALERGMERTLAALGRDVVRDASQHNWAKPLRQLCEGCALEDLLIRAPYLGRRLCEILLETDGLKIAYTEEEGPHCELIRLPGFGGEY